MATTRLVPWENPALWLAAHERNCSLCSRTRNKNKKRITQCKLISFVWSAGQFDKKNSAAIQSKSSIIVLRIVETKNVRRIWKICFSILWTSYKSLKSEPSLRLIGRNWPHYTLHFHLNHTKKSSENRLHAWPKTQNVLPRRRTNNLKSRSPLTCTRLSTSKAITNWFWSSEL